MSDIREKGKSYKKYVSKKTGEIKVYVYDTIKYRKLVKPEDRKIRKKARSQILKHLGTLTEKQREEVLEYLKLTFPIEN